MAGRLSPTERIAARLVTTGMTAREVVELLAAHDAQVKAEAWDEGLHTLWQLNDPAFTIVITPDRALLTEADVQQALAENPYRAAETEAGR